MIFSYVGVKCASETAFALGLALIVSDDTPTSPPVTFGLFNLIALVVQSRSSNPAVWRHVCLFLLSPELLAQVYILYKHHLVIINYYLEERELRF